MCVFAWVLKWRRQPEWLHRRVRRGGRSSHRGLRWFTLVGGGGEWRWRRWGRGCGWWGVYPSQWCASRWGSLTAFPCLVGGGGSGCVGWGNVVPRILYDAVDQCAEYKQFQSSTKAMASVAQLAEDDRDVVLRDFTSAQRQIEFLLSVKLDHWEQLPWIFCGLSPPECLIQCSKIHHRSHGKSMFYDIFPGLFSAAGAA